MMEICELNSELKEQEGRGQASLAMKGSGLVAILNFSKSVGGVAGCFCVSKIKVQDVPNGGVLTCS